MKLIYQVEDKPKFPQLIVFALQQLLAIMTATLVVPVIINGNVGEMLADKPMSPAAALFGAGIGTLVYLLFTLRKSPVFLGSSFAFLGSMTSAFTGATTAALGYFGLLLGAVLAGLVYVVIAIIVKFCGSCKGCERNGARYENCPSLRTCNPYCYDAFFRIRQEER